MGARKQNAVTSDMLKPIPGAPHYLACEDGRILSLYSMDWLSAHIDPSTGYAQVSICEDGTAKVMKVHRLIALAFHSKPDGMYVVNHKDENKTNNRADNLEWVTQSENISYGTARQRAVDTAGIDNLRKSIAHARKVRLEKLKANERPVMNLNTGIVYQSMKEAADETGTRKTGIWSCCNGKQKTCGGFRWQYAEVS